MPTKSRKSKKPAKSAAAAPATAPRAAPSPAAGSLTPGNVRCECIVEPDGFRFDGKLYSSISSAAAAAAKSLGLSGTSFNGYVFWGLAKPSGRDGSTSRSSKLSFRS